MSNIMISIGSAIALAVENPRATAVIFGIAFIVSFGLFARPDASVAWRGMGRLSLAALTAPFRFLQSVVTMLRSYDSDERHYAGTREYLLYKLCQFQYLGIFLLCLLIFAGGLQGSFYALLPTDKFEERSAAAAAMNEQRDARATAMSDSSRLNSPTYLAAANESAASAKVAVDKQHTSNQDALNSLSSPQQKEVADAVVAYMQRFQSSEGERQRVAAQKAVTDFLGNPDACRLAACVDASTKNSLLAYVDGQLKKLELQAAATKAQGEASTAIARAAEAKAKVSDLDATIVDLQKTLDGLSIMSMLTSTFDGARVQASLWILGTALLAIIIIVWLGGISIDILTWVVTMMVALEHYVARSDQKSADPVPSPVLVPAISAELHD